MGNSPIHESPQGFAGEGGQRWSGLNYLGQIIFTIINTFAISKDLF